VSIEGVTRRFGDTIALDNVDFSIDDGEFVALLGRSGSGKSTLLRLLAGLDAPDSGQLTVPRERMVVFQEPRLLPWKRAIENVALGLKGSQQLARARAAMVEVGLGHRFDAYPATMSGGEAQRAALARALVRDPKLLLLDEPFAALDALTRMRMQRLVEALWARHRLSVLMITHDVDEAILLADRALVIERGCLLTSVKIDLPRPREVGQPGFVSLRKRLLGAIGVADADADAAAGPETTLLTANPPLDAPIPASRSRIAVA